MRRSQFVILLGILGVGCGGAPAPDHVIENAEMLIASGRAAQAVTRLQEARVDHPLDSALLFEIAYAQQAAAGQLEGPGRSGKAVSMLREAVETFQRVTEKPAEGLGDSAAFNAATTRLLLDDILKQSRERAEREANLVEAVSVLASLAARAPEHKEARQNLDHARYKLALLRQLPPDGEQDEEESPEDSSRPTSAVDAATTQIPDAEAEVVDGSTIVLHVPRGDREDGS